MPFMLTEDSITEMKTDAVVNAANTELAMGGGVCGAIFTAAGPEKLQRACWKTGPIRTGEAAITPGFRLPAKYIIHAAGPVYDPWSPQESERLLRSAYMSALELALQNDCRSIAFPLISSGIYGYPKREALNVATAAFRDFLSLHDMGIWLTIFIPSAFPADSALLQKIRKFAEDAGDQPAESAEHKENMEFPVVLRQLMTLHKKSGDEAGRKANLSPKEFLKLLTEEKPPKTRILAAAISLELTLEETETLLQSAGYALTRENKTDAAAEYFIRRGEYDIFELNEILFSLGQPLLGPELP